MVPGLRHLQGENRWGSDLTWAWGGSCCPMARLSPLVPGSLASLSLC